LTVNWPGPAHVRTQKERRKAAMGEAKPTVFVVDDDVSVARPLSRDLVLLLA
jgi:hypothetical protein